MSDRISPPTWTEWTRNPSERSASRKAFDEILGELRKEGMVEVRSSLFIHLARYCYVNQRNARVEVQDFILTVPDDVFHQVSPTFRVTEVDTVLRILVSAGLATVEEESKKLITRVVLTERQGPGEVARTHELQVILAYLKPFYNGWEPTALVARPSSFPTPDVVAEATGVDRAHLTAEGGCTLLQDRPEANEANPHPFLQDTVTKGKGPLLLLQFWPLPDPKGPPAGPEPEFSLLVPAQIPLLSLVREYCVPLLVAFFQSNDHYDLSTEIQAKYASYMHKYREKFAAKAGIPTIDKLDKVLSTSDTEGEAFASAIYVIAQVLRALGKGTSTSPRGSNNPAVYQAARIAYAHVMAWRVQKRKADKEASNKNQDSVILVTRLRETPGIIATDDLRKTLDSTRKMEIGQKYLSIIELLPLSPVREGARPPLFEILGGFIHREQVVRTFLELRDKESWAQRERLARLWARYGIPSVDGLVVSERDVSAEFLKLFELVHQERLLAVSLPDFLRDFLPEAADLNRMAAFVWPDGRRGPLSAMDLVVRGLDPLLYEDKDRLKKRPLAGVLGLARVYTMIVKAAWNIVLQEEGLFRYILRRIAAFFGSKAPAPKARAKVRSARAEVSRGSSISAGAAQVAAQKAADLKRLKDGAPLLRDKEALVSEREKAASQWCLKLDPEDNRRTRQAVDAEVARLVNKIIVEQLTEANGAKVALFLVEKSPILAQVTSSRAFHRYLYLTALARKAESLSR